MKETTTKSASLGRKNSRNFGNPFASAAIGDSGRIAPPRRLNSTPSESAKSPSARERPPSAHQNFKKGEAPPLLGAYVGGEAPRVVARNRDSVSSIAPFVNMLARPATGYSTAPSSNGVVGSLTAALPAQSLTLETITFQHIQETSSKRISTLDYLRKAYE